MRIDFRNDQRGYTLVLHQDLLGAFILYRHWYGLFNHRGGMKQQTFFDEKIAKREIDRIVRTRFKNGYRTTATL